VSLATYEPLTPEWWRNRLFDQLMYARPWLDTAERWYAGPHPAPDGYEGAESILSRLIAATELNVCALVVDAAVERMNVEGFKIDGKISGDCANIWQSNGLDLGSEQLFTEAFTAGTGYLLVDPEPNDDGWPTITVEPAASTIVEHVPGSSRRRAAGLRVWLDPLSGLVMAALHLPNDGMYSWTAPAGAQLALGTPTGLVTDTALLAAAGPMRWELADYVSSPGPVPLVPFANRARAGRPGVPEFTRVISVQRRIAKTLLDRLVMQEYSAFSQKYAAGMSPELDANGKAKKPLQMAIDRILMSEDPDVKFGQFTPDDIGPLLAAVADDVKHAAALVPTPPHYLLGELTNLAAEALKAAVASLVSRVRRHMRHREEPLEEVMRLALAAAGVDTPAATRMTTRWRNPEFRTEGELVDALTKMATLGVPEEALWERWGAEPDEITAWAAQRQANRLQQAATGALFAPPPA
jgi:hypothetical protein